MIALIGAVPAQRKVHTGLHLQVSTDEVTVSCDVNYCFLELILA